MLCLPPRSFAKRVDSTSVRQLGAQVDQCRADMVGQQPSHTRLVTREPGIEQCMMFLMRPVLATGGLGMVGHITLRQHLQPLDQLTGQRGAPRPHQRQMESAVLERDVVHGFMRRHVERMKRLTCRGLIGRRGAPTGAGGGLGLARQAKLVDLLRLARTQRADEEAAIGLARQQPFLLQPCQRLAQWNLADPQFVSEPLAIGAPPARIGLPDRPSDSDPYSLVGE